MKIKEIIKRIKTLIKRIWFCFKYSNLPWTAKALAGLTLVYALSPIDLIPDFIPLLGYLDDIIILPIMAYFTIKLIPNVIWEDSLSKIETVWEDGEPKKWAYAIPILCFWIVGVFLILKVIFKL